MGTTGTSPGDFWEFDSFHKLKIRPWLKVPVVSKPWTKVKSRWFQKRSTRPALYRVRHMYLNGSLDGRGAKIALATPMKFFTAIHKGV